MSRSSLLRVVPAALGAALLALASPAGAQHHPAAHTDSAKARAAHGAHGAAPATAGGGDHAASGWKEMDAFHKLMMATWHPASGKNDLAPTRARAGEMADAARSWAAAAVPKACDTPATRATVAALATDSRALANQATTTGATDAALKASLKALHDRFESVEHGCAPGKHGAH